MTTLEQNACWGGGGADEQVVFCFFFFVFLCCLQALIGQSDNQSSSNPQIGLIIKIIAHS